MTADAQICCIPPCLAEFTGFSELPHAG